jgi:hypothetical protein
MECLSAPATRMGHHMGATQIGLREHDQQRAVVLAHGEIDIADEPRQQPGAVEAGARVKRAVEGKARHRQRLAALAGLADRLVEVAPERLAREQAGIGIEHSVGLERSEHALEPRLEGVQAYQRHHAQHQAGRIAVDMVDIGRALGEIVGRPADHRHRNIAQGAFLAEYGQEGFHHARREAVAHHDAVDIA